MKKALITGASSGIGRELAILLAERGVDLILHGRNFTALQEVAAVINGKCTVLECVGDLATLHGTSTLLHIIDLHIPDTIINCAAFGLYGDLVSQNPKEVQEMVAANCAALVAISQYVAKLWCEKGMEGTILNVSSALGLIPSPGAAVYGATKAFVTSFSEALDVELQSKGIRVLCACPGRVATAFATRASKGKVSTKAPGGMILDPKDVAKAMLQQIESKKPLQVIDWRYKLLLFFQSCLPRSVALKKLYRSLKSRVN